MDKPGRAYSHTYETWITQNTEYNVNDEKSKSGFDRELECDCETLEDGLRQYLSGCQEYYTEWQPPTDEEIEAWEDEEYKKKINISRDEKGRLHKGAMIAKKRSCDEKEIWRLYNTGRYTVKDIVGLKGCSKSTVYNVIKKYKEKNEIN